MFFHCSSIVPFACRPGGATQRAEPRQLRQEDCDAVWNELAYFKNLTGKLTVEKWVPCFNVSGCDSNDILMA